VRGRNNSSEGLRKHGKRRVTLRKAFTFHFLHEIELLEWGGSLEEARLFGQGSRQLKLLAAEANRKRGRRVTASAK